MKIDFCGPVVPASDGGISYKLKIDNKTVACRITMEALQDVDPMHRQDDPVGQFKAHQDTLLSIAEKKIGKGQMQGNTVWVFTEDL